MDEARAISKTIKLNFHSLTMLMEVGTFPVSGYA